MSSLSVIFCGTPTFAVPSLQALIDDPAFSVDLVITQPDRPVGRKQILTPPPVKELAEKHGIPVWQPDDINKELTNLPTSQPPDFLVVVAYGQLLSSEVLAIPTIAPVNVHPSLLPRWRGAAPYQQTVLEGDTETGVSIQKIVLQMDAGPILAQESINIDNQITASQLHDQLSDMGAALLIETLKEPLSPQEQDESQVTHCRKFTREDGQVDPTTMTAEEIDRHVRALVPWPGVQCTIDGNDVKLLQTSLKPSDGAIELPCAQNTILYIEKLQSPGRKALPAKEWKIGKM